MPNDDKITLEDELDLLEPENGIFTRPALKEEENGQ